MRTKRKEASPPLFAKPQHPPPSQLFVLWTAEHGTVFTSSIYEDSIDRDLKEHPRHNLRKVTYVPEGSSQEASGGSRTLEAYREAIRTLERSQNAKGELSKEALWKFFDAIATLENTDS